MRIDLTNDLADHGVRKYDYETGRFNSIDPLWEKYLGGTPYHYTRNNPVWRTDRSGLADYFDEKGRKIHDGVDDGRRIAVPSYVFDYNTYTNDDGTIFYDFNSMEAFGYELPNPAVAEKILEDNKWTAYHKQNELETAGVGNTTDYIHGGVGNKRNNATDAVLLALNKAKSLGITPTYYVHKHPDGNLNPTDPADYNAINQLRVNYGILVGKVGVDLKILLFRTNNEKMIISGDEFKGE